MKYLIILIVIIAIVILVEYNSITRLKNRIEAAELELDKYIKTGSEKDIDNAQKYYNAVIRDYNSKIEGFPGSLVAGMFNFPVLHSRNFDEGEK